MTAHVSIIIPVYNEEDNVHTLARDITDALSSRKEEWECLWVDDGSTDATATALADVCAKDARHTYICHDGNFGQSAALYTGFGAAHGAILVTLDGDGQNDPKDIPLMLDRLSVGDVDMVNGVRVTRRDSLTRRLSSRIGNAVRRAFLRDGVTDVGCALRVMRREMVENVPVFKGMHRFLPALAQVHGCRCVEMPVAHHPRRRGVAKYGVGNRLWVGIADIFGVWWWRRRQVYPRTRHTQTPSTRT